MSAVNKTNCNLIIMGDWNVKGRNKAEPNIAGVFGLGVTHTVL